MPTINFVVGSATVNWDGGNSIGTDQHAGLINQATRNVTGAQQGSPAPPEVIADIVAFEESLFSTQLIMPGVGRLDSDGARGGPEALSTMAKTAGRFDLFDAWANDINPRRAQIARGQELFNNTNAGGRSCSGCHNSANNGTNINNVLFDIRTASAEARTPDLPLYTFRTKTTAETRQLTDAGRGQVTGLWSDPVASRHQRFVRFRLALRTFTTELPQRSTKWYVTMNVTLGLFSPIRNERIW